MFSGSDNNGDSGSQATTPGSTPQSGNGGVGVVQSTPKPTGPKIQVGTVQFGSYMTAIGATKYAKDRGVTIELVDLTGEEATQCDWVAGRLPNDKPAQGVTRILFTTHNAARVCQDVKIAMVIDQSSGADMFVTRPDVADFATIFKNPVIMAGGCSVSEYLYRTVAWTFGALDGGNLRLTDGPDQAVQTFRADPSIKTLVSYVPSATDALSQNAGSKSFLTTETWAGILDVAVIKSESGVNDTTKRFLLAWYDFLKLEQENFDEAWKVLEGWHKDNRETTLIRDYDRDVLRDELTNYVAQATLVDNVKMMVQDTKVLEARLSEVDAVQREFPCSRLGQVPLPSSFSPREMIDGRYIQAIQNDGKIQTTARRLSKRGITLSTLVPLDQTLSSASEKLIGELASVRIEFIADSDQFRDENAAREVIERNFVPILRLTNNTVLELVGGYAAPRGCIDCTAASGRDIALRRAQRVVDYIAQEFGVDKKRLRVSQTVREPQFRDSADPRQVVEDRRVEGKLLVVGGQ